MGNLIVLGLVILIVFGPERLPGIARKLGRMMETFRRAADEFKSQIMTMDQEPPKHEEPPPYTGDTPTDQDGVSHSSVEESSAEAYNNPYQDASPYPGNEEYAAGLNVTEPATAQEDAAPPADEQAQAQTPEPETAEAKPPESENAL